MQQHAVASSPFSAYADRPQLGLDVEFGADPASGAAFFQSDGRKHDDLKQMLDSNKDGLKLEAMKRIIGMIARGRDASDLFPAVVKNVVSKNIEVKKLVYVYLVRYAEEQQDLALLSISTFQRALKDPNQLIRASALRVLSSIRVSMIVPIVMLAIRDSAADLSPYVRKTAAHAIPKLYSLDPEQKDELVMLIEKLLSDRTTLVVGSAVMAFDEVCPERVDLVHKNYRKLCNLLVDVDEWGQVIIINMLTRYARTQFEDPNADEDVALVDNPDSAANTAFYNESSSSSSSSESESPNKTSNSNNNSSRRHATQTNQKAQKLQRRSSSPVNTYTINLDHRLLLRQTKPLLQSRNASVVMAVAQLYHHVAPRNEVQLIAKALIRLLRSHKEIQSVVLTCIASMATKRKPIFEPHLKSFFVRTSSDQTHIKLLKLDILTNLASASSISLILREFQTYISSSDRPFVAATIQAIGRCAASICEVTETCLSGLVHLLSNRDEHVVAESIVVIKQLLQTKAAEHFEIITQMAKLIDFITVPAARAAIIWLIGEYNEKVPKIAPDVLRKMAKTFVDEEDVVKLQVLNLGVKLYLTNPQQTSLLCQYVFTLARYDTNYDVRDRARFLRQFIFPASGESTILSESARKVFLTAKPAPSPESKYRDSNNFQLGSLSHYLNMRATGYKELPSFPAVAPDPSVRNIEGYMQDAADKKTTAAGKQTAAGKEDKSFLSESDGKSSRYSQTNSSSSSSSDSGSESSSESSSSASEEDAVGKESAGAKQKKSKSKNQLNSSESAPTLSQEGKENVETAELVSTNENNEDNSLKEVSGTSDSESSSYDSSDSGSESDDDDDDNGDDNDNKDGNRKNVNDDAAVQTSPEHSKRSIKSSGTAPSTSSASAVPSERSNLELLLDLDDILPVGSVMTPSLGGFLTPGTPMLSTLQPQHIANRIELVGPSHIEFKHKPLLNKLTGHGLQLSYRFTRAPHLYSASMVSIELQFVNQAQTEIQNVQLGKKTLPAGMQLNEFAPIQQLQPLQVATSIIGVDFNDSTHAIDFELTSTEGTSRVQLKPPIGELVRAVQITDTFFKDERTKLRGMNEHQSQLALSFANVDLAMLKQKIFECVNVAFIPITTTTTAAVATATTTNEQTEPLFYFAGQTLNSKSLVLITLLWSSPDAPTMSITVNCEKMVIGSMLLNELRNALQAHSKI